MNTYANVIAFQRRMLDGKALDPKDAMEILQLLTTASRHADDYVDRAFFVKTATPAAFPGNGLDRIRIPDLVSASAVKLDENTDGVFEVDLTEDTDFWLEREGHEDVSAQPSTIIILNPYKGSRSSFVSRPRLLQIAGDWGYTNASEVVAGVTATLADSTATEMTTNKVGDLSVGDTVLVETERLFIKGRVRGGGASPKWTVDRGVNGSTAASHTDKAVSRYTYVPQVVDAVMMQTARWWKRRETAFSTTIANPAMGTIETYKGLDPDVKDLLDPFRKLSW